MVKRIVHCKKNLFDVYIGRGSIWGNPFKIGQDGTRKQVIELYRLWVLHSPSDRAKEIRRRVWELEGKILGCYCSPKACHGDVLLEILGEKTS